MMHLTLDDFMAGDNLSEVDLAACLGTDDQRTFPVDDHARPAPYRDLQPPYGSHMALLMRTGAGDLALQTEIERCMVIVGLPGTAVVHERVATAVTATATLTVNPDGVSING